MNRIISFLFALIISFTATAQINVRVMHYNLLQFGNSCDGVSISDKYNWLGTVLNEYRPHLFTVNELSPNIVYANGIKALSFDYTNDIANSTITNNTGSQIVNMLFYDSNIFELTGNEVISGSLRDINVYHLYVKETAQNNDTSFLDLIVAHFKAGNGGSDAVQRENSAISIMNYIQVKGQGKNILVMGDFNIYDNTEAAFQQMVFNSNSNISLVDPAGKQNGWFGASNVGVLTQSTRSNSPDCGSGGGLDDRFDMILASKAIMGDSAGIKYVDNSYASFGNGSNSFNQELACTGNVVPLNVCIALKQMSDHLPVVLELQLSGVTSLEKKLELAGVNLYKLPYSTDQSIDIQVSIKEPKSENLTLEVWNLLGQKLYKKDIPFQTQTVQLPFSMEANGAYFIRLSDKNGRSQWLKI